jgi:hypothetical protein
VRDTSLIQLFHAYAIASIARTVRSWSISWIVISWPTDRTPNHATDDGAANERTKAAPPACLRGMRRKGDKNSGKNRCESEVFKNYRFHHFFSALTKEFIPVFLHGFFLRADGEQDGYFRVHLS